MRYRNQLGAIGAAVLLGIGVVATAPRLYGGGGDEGVDVMPSISSRGSPSSSGSSSSSSSSSSASASSSSTFGSLSGGTRPANGFLTIHGAVGASDFGSAVPLASGVSVLSHTKADLYFGLRGTEPVQGATALDVVTKGTRKLQFGELKSASALAPSQVCLNGRFEYEDVDASKRQVVQLVTRMRKAGTLAVLVGNRSTHDGSIAASFSSIDSVTYESVPYGVVDVASHRAAMQAALAGTGKDVGLALYATAPAGTDEVWAAFNVDDQRAVYDVEVNLAH